MSFIIDAADAIATALDGATFDYGAFDVTYDYESRLKDEDLTSEDVSVRVIVPRTYHEIKRIDQSTLRYVAPFDIDIRKRLGATSQGVSAPGIPKDGLEDLSQLVEDIHAWFHDNDPELGTNDDIIWASEDTDLGVESKILIAYSVKYLRDSRQFYAVCREFFWRAIST